MPTYDGNGNITAYVDVGTAQVAATFEYAPFGGLLGVWYSSDTVKADARTLAGLWYERRERIAVLDPGADHVVGPQVKTKSQERRA